MYCSKSIAQSMDLRQLGQRWLNFKSYILYLDIKPKDFNASGFQYLTALRWVSALLGWITELSRPGFSIKT